MKTPRYRNASSPPFGPFSAEPCTITKAVVILMMQTNAAKRVKRPTTISDEQTASAKIESEAGRRSDAEGVDKLL